MKINPSFSFIQSLSDHGQSPQGEFSLAAAAGNMAVEAASEAAVQAKPASPDQTEQDYSSRHGDVASTGNPASIRHVNGPLDGRTFVITGRFPFRVYDEERDGYFEDEPSESGIQAMFQTQAPNAHLATSVNERTDYLVVGWYPDGNLVRAADNGFTRIIRTNEYLRLLQENADALEAGRMALNDIAEEADRIALNGTAEDASNPDHSIANPSVLSVHTLHPIASPLHLSEQSRLDGHVDIISGDLAGES